MPTNGPTGSPAGCRSTTTSRSSAITTACPISWSPRWSRRASRRRSSRSTSSPRGWPRTRGCGGVDRPRPTPINMPSSHRAHAEWTPSRIVRWAQKTGPATGHLVSEILERRRHPEQGYRACLGILRLGRRHGDERLEAACRRAAHLDSYSYRTIKNILSSGQDRLPIAQEPPAAAETPHHDNIRGATYYAAKETPNAE